MPWVLVKRERTKQPQNTVGINLDNALTKGLAACFNGPYGFELVNRRQFLRSGSPTASAAASGMTIGVSTGGSSFDGMYAPELAAGSPSDKAYSPIAPPITLFLVGNAKSTNEGAGLSRGLGSGMPSFGVCFWDGSFAGASFAIKTSGGQLDYVSPSTTAKVTSGVNIAVCSIGPVYTTIYCSNGQKDTYSTPSGNFYYEYDDKWRCLSYGGSYVNGNGNIALAGMVSGVAWTERESFLFMANPWQIFEPEIVPLWVPVGVSVQIARPIADISNTGWTPSSGTDLFAMIGETVRDDATYVYATEPGSIFEDALSVIADPAVSTGHMPTLILAAPGGGGITVRLRQGTTTIASWTYYPGTSPTEYTPTLSSGAADSITDYGALRFQFEAVA